MSMALGTACVATITRTESLQQRVTTREVSTSGNGATSEMMERTKVQRRLHEARTVQIHGNGGAERCLRVWYKPLRRGDLLLWRSMTFQVHCRDVTPCCSSATDTLPSNFQISSNHNRLSNGTLVDRRMRRRRALTSATSSHHPGERS